MGPDVEAVEHNIEVTIQSMTLAAGYNLPKNLVLVTRELLDYDETAGRRPAAIIQTTGIRSELIGIGGVAQSTLSGRVVCYYDLDTGALKPVTWHNAYMTALRTALLVDRGRGNNAQVLTTLIPEEATALLWKAGQAFQSTLLYEVIMMHDGGA